MGATIVVPTPRTALSWRRGGLTEDIDPAIGSPGTWSLTLVLSSGRKLPDPVLKAALAGIGLLIWEVRTDAAAATPNPIAAIFNPLLSPITLAEDLIPSLIAPNTLDIMLPERFSPAMPC